MKTVFLVTILLIIFYQDIRKRAVLWFLFPLLFGATIWYRHDLLKWNEVLLNNMFVLFLLSFLTLYISVRQKKITAIWNGFFSWGDILFIIAITPLCTFFDYIYFFTFGTVIVLIIHLIAIQFSKNKTVPYAGYLSLVTIGYVLLEKQVQSFFYLLNGAS